ncbi:MAG: phenylacetate--CoA ligase family protein [Bdellovibrionaceae bacterium]|nr:phenylacetate--CoA ligase family protein [Pseudobdellovibrionaceae bacterium]
MNLLSQRTHPTFHDHWEAIGAQERQSLVLKHLTEFIQFCRHRVPFYKDRLEGFQSQSPYPLKDIPVMTSDTLRELVPPISYDLLSEDTRDYTVFQSGGTTGFPKSTLFSHAELELLNLGNARGFFAMGLSADDRVGNLFAVGGLYMTFIHINRMLQQYGCMNFPFSNHTAVDFIHTATKLYNINCFAGITSVVLSALRGMSTMGMDGIQIKKVFYGGEHIYEADKIELREKFGVEVIGAPGYGTVDTWYIGYQCLHSPTGTFHAHDDQCYIEIFDEDENKHVSGEGVGMLYATPMVRRLTPIVRYRVGDRAQWLETPCECGRQTPRFRLLGRGDDVLRIGYDSVDYNFIQTIVAQFKELSGTIQMQKQRVDGRDQLVILIETESKNHSHLAQQIADEITNNRPTLRDHVKKQTVWPVHVHLVAPHTIERNVRTGKLIRVKDAVQEKHK